MATPKAKLNQIFTRSTQQPEYVTCAEAPATTPPELGLYSLLAPPAPHSFFYCTLKLPNGVTVVSHPCRRKKEAEQDAACKALAQMGRPFVQQDSPGILSVHEIWTALKNRVVAAFSVQCVLNYKPLMEHFRAAVQRSGQVPATVLAALDTKIISLCKALDKSIDEDPARAVTLVCRAARECIALKCEDDGLWIGRVESYPEEVRHELLRINLEPGDPLENSLVESVVLVNGSCTYQFEAVYIPCLQEKVVTSIQLKLNSNEYYMDVLAHKLGLNDAGHVMISRSIQKAPSGTRLYWPLRLHEDAHEAKPHRNRRASILLGYPVFGDAILAAVGSTWKSEGRMSVENVSLGCYYRLLLGRSPEGFYKLSRGAVLVSELPASYTSKFQWRGPMPRSILTEFCHQLHLDEPTLSILGNEHLITIASFNGTCDKCVKQTDCHNAKEAQHLPENQNDDLGISGPFTCQLKMQVRNYVLECSSEQSYRNRNDAIQSACWKALLQLSQALDNGVGHWSSIGEPKKHIAPRENSQMHDVSQNWEIIRGEESRKRPPAGSVVSIAYDIHLVGEGMDEQIETNEDFDFEIGSGAVIGMLDACVSNLFVGQTAQFSMQPFPNELLYASCQEIINKIRNLNLVLEDFRLDFTVTLKSFLEAPEERMESAFFSPPLSRQRIDFAVNLIRESQATSLVDLGCGSGSFLDAIFECQTNLAHIAGVDISPKSLVRAAKSLQVKISKNHQNTHLEDVLLYEGSIAEPDSRLYDYDMATCIEVVEHMDPDPLSKVGESILGTMSPKVLVLSTPNIEYNKILQGISNKFSQKTEDPEQKDPNESANSLAIKLRNDDHRFEWTRAEFCTWASGIAAQFGYSVDFTGVGKSSDEDPGFASQIAIFRRLQSSSEVNSESKTPPQLSPYKEVWKWSGIS